MPPPSSPCPPRASFLNPLPHHLARRTSRRLRLCIAPPRLRHWRMSRLGPQLPPFLPKLRRRATPARSTDRWLLDATHAHARRQTGRGRVPHPCCTGWPFGRVQQRSPADGRGADTVAAFTPLRIPARIERGPGWNEGAGGGRGLQHQRASRHASEHGTGTIALVLGSALSIRTLPLLRRALGANTDTHVAQVPRERGRIRGLRCGRLLRFTLRLAGLGVICVRATRGRPQLLQCLHPQCKRARAAHRLPVPRGAASRCWLERWRHVRTSLKHCVADGAGTTPTRPSTTTAYRPAPTSSATRPRTTTGARPTTLVPLL
ncbi:hypothetical protein B0H19DRAFT_1247359 [Mycena capillaripes]|nr:hypothetical protein B0H19DRAFT_1247359 [Mycena capillaripes]